MANGADLRLTTSWRFVRSKPQRPNLSKGELGDNGSVIPMPKGKK
jgi:hypothetical protein